MAITAELSYRHTHTHTHKDIIATQVIELTNGMEQIGELLSSYFFKIEKRKQIATNRNT
jgi:hypothetical protein